MGFERMAQKEVAGTLEHGEGMEEEADLRARSCKPKCVEGLEEEVNE